MTTLSRVTCLIGLATAVLSTGGCDPYTYYNVHVTLQLQGDNAVKIPNTLDNISTCDVSVYATDSSTAIERGIALNQRTLGPQVSPCRGPDTPTDLGILDYSTARSSGSLSFRVNIYQVGGGVIIQGTTTPVAVSPGHILPTIELPVSPCGPPGNQDQPNQQPCQ
ncbi:MAG: hypothetical protein WCG85_23900 [Polyangia bacterium]